MSEDEAPEPKGWKKPLLIVLATAPIAVVLFTMFFMAQYEAAFDEGRCPYEPGELRRAGEGVQVREDRRVCQPGVEERRWVLLREGRRPLELGRRPLEEAAYRGTYAWSATLEQGRVRVEVQNPGMDPRVFREPAPDSGLADY